MQPEKKLTLWKESKRRGEYTAGSLCHLWPHLGLRQPYWNQAYPSCSPAGDRVVKSSMGPPSCSTLVHPSSLMVRGLSEAIFSSEVCVICKFDKHAIVSLPPTYFQHGKWAGHRTELCASPWKHSNDMTGAHQPQTDTVTLKSSIFSKCGTAENHFKADLPAERKH